MVKELSPPEVYEILSQQGEYEEAQYDQDEMQKVLTMVLEDYAFGKRLRNVPNPSWRVIFNVHYDILRELCDQLIRFKHQKISNHQGLFAFMVLHFKELELDWSFLERIRIARNRNKYQSLDISKEMWQGVQLFSLI